MENGCGCRRVKMTRLRARVAERLKGAQNTYAMLTTFNEIDMTNLMQLRSTYKVNFSTWRYLLREGTLLERAASSYAFHGNALL